MDVSAIMGVSGFSLSARFPLGVTAERTHSHTFPAIVYSQHSGSQENRGEIKLASNDEILVVF